MSCTVWKVYKYVDFSGPKKLRICTLSTQCQGMIMIVYFMLSSA